jgi:hypothetical protein
VNLIMYMYSNYVKGKESIADMKVVRNLFCV